MPREFNVVTTDGFVDTWYETFRSRLFHYFPKVRDFGIVYLRGKVYVNDPSRNLRSRYRPKRYLKLIEMEDQISYWRDGNPDQMDMTEWPSSYNGWTGENVAQMADKKLISEAMNDATDWKWYLILILAVTTLLMGVALAGASGLHL